MNSIGIVYTTVSTQDQADMLAGKVLDAQLAACINVYPKVRSQYLWKGQIEASEEVAMIFKTTLDKMESLQQYLEAYHPYEVPLILKGAGEVNAPFWAYVLTVLD
jgi:periplasmic divalent cation tolerance protein